MQVNEKAFEILQEYAKILISLSDRLQTVDENGEKYLDMSKVENNKQKRRVLLAWIGEMLESALDDLRDSGADDYDIDSFIEKTRGVRLLDQTDMSTISLGKVLAFEILDLLDDETDETDHSFS